MLMHVESKTKKRKTGKGRSYLLHQKLFEDEEGKGQPPPPLYVLSYLTSSQANAPFSIL